MTSDNRRELIERYRDGYNQVSNALAGFPKDKLTAHPLAGKWSAAEIVHHLADSETISGIRFRRLLVEENPLIEGYDQDIFADRLHYNVRDMAPALEAFRNARSTTAQLFETMSDDDWKRAGTHTESGTYSAEDWLGIYAAHAHNHAAQIVRLRDALAKESVAKASAT